MKKLFTLALLAAGLLSASAVDVPWTSAGLTSADGWKTHDANGSVGADGQWTLGTDFAQYAYWGQKEADDYLYSPSLELKSGTQYTIDYDLASDYGTDKMSVLLCTATDAASLAAGTVIDNFEFSKGNYNKTRDFTVETDGAYYIAFHLTSEKGQGNIKVSQFSISGQAGSGKENANLSFTPAELSIYLANGAVDMPALSNINNVEGIVYTVSPEGIVEIADGKLNPLAAGEATLTASVPEDNAEWEGSATC